MYYERGSDYLGRTQIIKSVLTFLLDKHNGSDCNGCGLILINKIFLYFSKRNRIKDKFELFTI